MKFSVKLFIQILLIISLLSSCADGELFGKKTPPLPGTRVNVLHYDLMKNENPNESKNISIPAQTVLSAWVCSDIGQFTELAENISLGNNLKLVNNFHPKNFNPSSLDSAILIVDNILYSYTKSTLAAYDLTKNRNLWSKEAVEGKERNDVLGGSMTYANGVIYLSSGSRDLIAFEADSGKELWRFKAPNVVRHIALINENKIYVNSTDNTLSCLSLDGKLLWRYDGAIYSLITSRFYSPNIVYQDKLITITTAGDLVVLNKHDGQEITQVNLATTSIIGDGSLAKGPIASPELINNHLYILTGENDFIKIDLENPQILWRQNFPSAKAFWVADSTAYLLSDNNQLLAVDNSNGKTIWAIDLPRKQKAKELVQFYGPVLAGDMLILTSYNGEFFTFSPKDGKLISSYKNNFSTNQMPFIVNDKAYFIGTNGSISVWQ